LAQEFFNDYFEFVGDTEAPTAFHRWSIISCVAAALGRKCYVPLGHFKIYPNMYTMLVGSSGTRKSVSIGLAKQLLKSAGYANFSADKTSKEKFIADLMDKNHNVQNLTELKDVKISDTAVNDAECFIVSDEFQDFMGQNNIDFITTLGKLWDVKDEYEHRIKSGQSSMVHNIIISILGGTTPTGFSLIFPPEIVGQGFLSRLLLIQGDSTGNKIAWPVKGSTAVEGKLIQKLKRILALPRFTFGLTQGARDALTTIYNTSISINDPRFTSYETRRHSHLLKLCSIMCVLSGRQEITSTDVLQANTLLYYAERRMPLALGEFGKGRFSEVSSQVLEALQRSPVPMNFMDIWKVVAQDLNSQKDLVDVIRGLQGLEKLQQVTSNGEIKFLPKREQADYFNSSLLLPSFLTEDERITGGYDESNTTELMGIAG